MSLNENHDRFEVLEATLSEVVGMCSDCEAFCLSRTMRAIQNYSRAPRGWEKEFAAEAEKQRKVEMAACVEACKAVSTACPTGLQIDRIEREAPRRQGKVNVGKDTPDFPDAAVLSRCEKTAGRFVQVLFAIAHKPYKVAFLMNNLKSGEEIKAEPTKTEPLRLSGELRHDASTIDEEILRRWSSARRERQAMEKEGVLRTEEAARDLKRDMDRASGSLPKW